MIEQRQLILPSEAPWLGTYVHELLAFPHGRYDDQVDATSQLLAWVSRQQRQTRVVNAGPELIVVRDDGWVDVIGEKSFSYRPGRRGGKGYPFGPWSA